MSLLGDTWTAFNDPLNDGWGRTWQHARLALIALGWATGIGVILGIVCAKVGRAASFLVTMTANLGRTVPTFAVIALVGAVWALGEGPAVLGLVALAVPPILLNTFTGIHEVDAGAVEASRGMGLTSLQILGRVELPIALPLVFAGIRTSAVQVIATATLASVVAAGGLGDLVIAGLSNQQNDVLLAGAIPVAILALMAEALFGAAEWLITPRGLRIGRRLAIREGRTA